MITIKLKHKDALVFTYEEWVLRNQWATEFDEDEQECHSCYGNGECDCPECGAPHDCGTCEGTGILKDPLLDSKNIYTNQRDKDLKLWGKHWERHYERESGSEA